MFIRFAALFLGLALVPVTARATPPAYLEAPALPVYEITPAGFTVECWIRVRSLPAFDPMIVQCASRDHGPCDATNAGYWSLGICKLSDCAIGVVTFFLQGEGECRLVQSTSRVDDGSYHHIAGTFDGRRLMILIDGKVEASAAAPAITVRLVAGRLIVGNRAGHDSPFDGVIDELRIWSVARTESEIRAWMAREIPKPPPALAGSWSFNGSGEDRSPRKNGLTPVNTVVYRKGRLGEGVDVINIDSLRGENREPHRHAVPGEGGGSMRPMIGSPGLSGRPSPAPGKPVTPEAGFRSVSLPEGIPPPEGEQGLSREGIMSNRSAIFRPMVTGAILLISLLAAAAGRAQTSTGEIIHGGGRPPAGRGGLEDAGPGDARIMLHLMTPSTKFACTRARVPAVSAVVNSRDVAPASDGLYPRYYFAYVLVTSADVAAGVAGVQFGIQYDSGPETGLFMDHWMPCIDLQFNSPFPAWPASGSGTLLTWRHDASCQRVEPGGGGTGVVAVAGYFYCTAYTDAVLSITPRPVDGKARISTCNAVVIEVKDCELGSAGFGVLSGNNPAIPEIPPAAITDLAITAATQSSLTLSWTAPGDDGNVGTPISYDMRFSTEPITGEDFAAAPEVSGEPAPAAAGTVQETVVDGLIPSTTYYFALKSIDNACAASPISNVGSGSTTADLIPPAAVTNLSVATTTSNSAVLTWTAPGGDGNVGVAAVYDIRYATSLISAGNFSAATAAFGEPAPGPAGTAQQMTVGGLVPSTTYYFAMKTSDGAGNVSPVSNSPAASTLTGPPAPAFSDVAPFLGMAASAVSQGTAWGDYDGDGDIDLYVANFIGPGRLFRNEGDGSFHDVAPSAGVNEPDSGRSVAWCDFDNDGDLDLYLARTGTNRLYRNDGGGVFADVAAPSQTADGGDGRGVAWADYDRDGDVDLYVANEINPGRLYGNEGGGLFLDVGGASGTDNGGYARGVAWADEDGDGDSDLYVANVDASRLYRNDGTGVFAEIGAASGTIGPTASVGVAWGDYDNDGDFDLYVSRWGVNSLYRNEGSSVFVDVATAAGVDDGGSGNGVAWGDVDNDGDLDLYLANHSGASRLFRNEDDGTFADLDTASGAYGEGEGQGLAMGDYDSDGDLDIFVTKSNGSNNLFRNDSMVPPGHHWLHVNLVGIASNRSAIGARLRCVTGSRRQTREISGGSGYFSQNSLTEEFGLGTAALVDTLEIRWPSGTVQMLVGVGVDQRITVTEMANPAPVFADAGAGLPGLVNGEASWGDYDGDGDLDIALAGFTLTPQIYRNDNAVFTPVQNLFPSLCPVWGDFDGDGDLDLVLVGAQSHLYRNDAGVMNWMGFAGLPTGDAARAVCGDDDNDGDLDLLFTGYPPSSPGPITRVYRNQAMTFADAGVTLPGMVYANAAWGDYDNDGDLDVLLSGPPTAIYRNDGGAYADIAASFASRSQSSADWGDYDTDGDLDVLLTGEILATPISTVYRNDSGSFVDVAAGLVGMRSGSAVWGDYDADGDPDIAMTGVTPSGPAARLYRNDNGTFTSVPSGLTGVFAGSLAWGDYDNDGALDLLAAGHDGVATRTTVYRNMTGAANTPPGFPSNLSFELNGPLATFSWTPAMDAETPSAGLTYNLRVGTTPGGNEISASMAAPSGYRRVVRPGNAGHSLEWTIDLSSTRWSSTFNWSVQAVDAGFAGSPFVPGPVSGTDAPSVTGVRLLPNSPNPFRIATTIGFEVPGPVSLSLEVFDILGRRLRTLARGTAPAGRNEITWDGLDDAGRPVEAGVYFYRLTSNRLELTRKMIRTN